MKPALTLVAVMLATPAVAQEPVAQCMPTIQAADAMLLARFNQVRVGLGMRHGNREAAQLYLSKAGTWTIVTTNKDGVTCLVMNGFAWERLGPKLPAPGQRPTSIP